MATFRDGRKTPVDLHFEVEWHEGKLKEILLKLSREQFLEMIEDVTIVDAKGSIKIRLPGIKEAGFNFVSSGKSARVGEAGEGDEKIPGESGEGDSNGAGDQPGEDRYEPYEIDPELLQQLYFERWKIPPPLPKEMGPLLHEKKRYLHGHRRRGALSDLFRRMTMRRRLRRISSSQPPESISPANGNENIDDYRKWWRRQPIHANYRRFFSFETKEEGSKAVKYNGRDASGSINQEILNFYRLIFTYTDIYVERSFPETERIYFFHDEVAHRKKESEFYERKSSGGTKMSSIFDAILEDIAANHAPDEENIYVQYASDGENKSGDNKLAVERVKELLQMVRQLIYIETANVQSDFFNELQAISQDSEYKNLVVAHTRVFDPEAARAVLDKIFAREEADDGGV